MTRLPIRRPYLALLLLCAACSDDELSGPITAAPNAYIMPNTDESCGTACLRDDIVGNWSVSLHPSSGTYLTLSDSKAPTTGGERVEATYCIYRTSDDYLYGCTQPASWFTSYAYRPDGHVIIEGRDVQGYARVRFTGQAPTPEVELLEYERPAVANCSGFYCYGNYRLKIAIRNTGWYGSDRVYITGENETGSRWPLSDAGASVSDETAQWTWTQVHPSYPGSRIVASYHPWGSTLDDVIEFSVPLRDDSPTLTLEATEAPTPVSEAGGPMTVDVAAGTPALFTPDAGSATLVEVLGWEWTPADTTQPSETGACMPGVNPCETPVYEDGTMEVTARVDGQMREATAPVGMVEPTVSCFPAAPIRGDTITCTLSPAEAATDLIRWEFAGPDGEGPTNSTAGAVWDGPAVIGGTVRAVLSTGSPSATFTVTPRDWSGIAATVEVPTWTWWSPDDPYLTFKAKPTEVHDLGHVDFVRSGLDTDAIVIVGEGPNALFAYYATVPYSVTAHVHVHPELAVESDFWNAQRVYDLDDGICDRNDVVPFIDVVLEHEGITGSDTSHIGLFESELAENGSQPVEGVYSYNDYGGLADAATDAFAQLFVAADAEPARADTEYFPDHCTFTYSY